LGKYPIKSSYFYKSKILTSSLPAKELSKELGISCNAIYAIRFRAKNSKGEIKMRIEDIS
jgi:hypothetical protein